MSTTAQLMIFAEFEKLPDMPGQQELINGEPIILPPPENQHSLISARIFALLLTRWPTGREWRDHTREDNSAEPFGLSTWQRDRDDDHCERQRPRESPNHERSTMKSMKDMKDSTMEDVEIMDRVGVGGAR